MHLRTLLLSAAFLATPAVAELQFPAAPNQAPAQRPNRAAGQCQNQLKAASQISIYANACLDEDIDEAAERPYRTAYQQLRRQARAAGCDDGSHSESDAVLQQEVQRARANLPRYCSAIKTEVERNVRRYGQR